MTKTYMHDVLEELPESVPTKHASGPFLVESDEHTGQHLVLSVGFDDPDDSRCGKVLAKCETRADAVLIVTACNGYLTALNAALAGIQGAKS